MFGSKMKGLKLKSGIIILFTFFLIIPNGSSATSVNDTVFLAPAQMTDLYIIDSSLGDIVIWSFRTYDDPFSVTATCAGTTLFSQGKTSDSGSVEALIPGGLIFYFMNTGPNSGYIDINIHIKQDTIEGYHPIIFIVILISIISIISIKKMNIKTTN